MPFDAQPFFDQVRAIANKGQVLVVPIHPAASPADLAAARAALDQTPGEAAFLCQVGPVPAANGNEAPPAEAPGVVQLRADLFQSRMPGDPDYHAEGPIASASPSGTQLPSVVELRADLGAVAGKAAKVLGLLGARYPVLHSLTFGPRGWQASLSGGDGTVWPLRAQRCEKDAHAAVRATLEEAARWLARHTPAWRALLPGEGFREALTGLLEAMAGAYARAGGGW